MHLVLFPLSDVLTTIGPNIGANSLNIVLSKIAFIACTIRPHEFTFTVFGAGLKISCVLAVFVFVVTLSILFVILPLASVN